MINRLVLLCLLLSCSGSNKDLRDELEETIINKSNLAVTNKKKYSQLRLSDITRFDWDKFYIFEEYVGEKSIQQINGI